MMTRRKETEKLLLLRRSIPHYKFIEFSIFFILPDQMPNRHPGKDEHRGSECDYCVRVPKGYVDGSIVSDTICQRRLFLSKEWKGKGKAKRPRRISERMSSFPGPLVG